MKDITLFPQSVCSKQIDIVVDDDNVIQSMKFVRGCTGNLQGISRLCIGHKLDYANRSWIQPGQWDTKKMQAWNEAAAEMYASWERISFLRCS